MGHRRSCARAEGRRRSWAHGRAAGVLRPGRSAKQPQRSCACSSRRGRDGLYMAGVVTWPAMCQRRVCGVWGGTVTSLGCSGGDACHALRPSWPLSHAHRKASSRIHACGGRPGASCASPDGTAGWLAARGGCTSSKDWRGRGGITVDTQSGYLSGESIREGGGGCSHRSHERASSIPWYSVSHRRYVCIYACVHDYIAVSIRKVTPPTTGTVHFCCSCVQPRCSSRHRQCPVQLSGRCIW